MRSCSNFKRGKWVLVNDAVEMNLKRLLEKRMHKHLENVGPKPGKKTIAKACYYAV